MPHPSLACLRKGSHFRCVHVCVCACSCVHAHVHMCVCVCRFLCICIWRPHINIKYFPQRRQALSLHVELTDSASLDSQQAPEWRVPTPPALGFQAHGTVPGSWDLNSGPQACMPSTFPMRHLPTQECTF